MNAGTRKGSERMMKKIGQEKKRLDAKRIRKIKKYEKIFSACQYAGRGKNSIETVQGKSVIAIAAPHSVNYFEDVKKKADTYTGGLACLLASETRCHALCLGTSHEENQKQLLADEIGEYIDRHNIQVIVDIQLVEPSDDTVIFLEQENNADDKSAFVQRTIRYSFEYIYRDRCSKTVSEKQYMNRSFTASAANDKGIAYVYLGINKDYLSLQATEKFSFFYDAFMKTMFMLSNLDWGAEKIKVYKLWQADIHKPQDKIEIAFSDENVGFDVDGESLLNICTYGLKQEKVRLHTPKTKTLKGFSNGNEYVFLTNRLIEVLFDREWIEGKEEEPGLREAPVIVYSNEKEVYPIGLPKANQIDGVFFSSALFEEKRQEAKSFDYVLFNRYTDSRFHIEYDKLDYADNGRVKSSDGKPAKKVMIPRYYKRLLGYLDYPLKIIREEEYNRILKNELSPEEKEAFEACYEKIGGEVFFKGRKEYICDENGEAEADHISEKKKIKDTVIDVQNRLGMYNSVEILRVPKAICPKEGFIKRIRHKWDHFKMLLLEKAIGKSEYLLKTEWTSETDDRNNIARLSSNMMSLLGVSEDDKILVKFGKEQVVLRVLAKEELTDYQIGIPAPARKALGMNSVNDIVTVHRDMNHIFKKHSEEQAMAILGTAITVFQMASQKWIGVLLCLIVTPLIIYFVLNEERVRVK